MTAKPSPVSLTPGQQPGSPTPGIYTAAASRWDGGQGAWLGYLDGDPPPTPKAEKERLSTPSHRRAPQLSWASLPLRFPSRSLPPPPPPYALSSATPPLCALLPFCCSARSPPSLLSSVPAPWSQFLPESSRLLHTLPLGPLASSLPLACLLVSFLPSFCLSSLPRGLPLLSGPLNGSLVVSPPPPRSCPSRSF